MFKKPYAIVDGVQYYTDPSGSVFCGDPLDQSGMVGGTGDRTSADAWRASIGSGRCLDYGCGAGNLVRSLRAAGLEAEGYDPFSTEFSKKPGGLFNTVYMIEVIEHTASPYSELGEIREMMVEGGRLIVETSFSNWVVVGDPYLNPKIGHSTIFSHLGLDVLMVSKGFSPAQHINRNVRIFTKF